MIKYKKMSKSKEILLKHLTANKSERLKKFIPLVNYTNYIAAMEEYAEYRINKSDSISDVSERLSPIDFCRQTICTVNGWTKKHFDNKSIEEIRLSRSHNEWFAGKDAVVFFANQMILNKCDEQYFREVLKTINE
jgi:hypothetical protein